MRRPRRRIPPSNYILTSRNVLARRLPQTAGVKSHHTMCGCSAAAAARATVVGLISHARHSVQTILRQIGVLLVGQVGEVLPIRTTLPRHDPSRMHIAINRCSLRTSVLLTGMTLYTTSCPAPSVICVASSASKSLALHPRRRRRRAFGGPPQSLGELSDATPPETSIVINTSTDIGARITTAHGPIPMVTTTLPWVRLAGFAGCQTRIGRDESVRVMPITSGGFRGPSMPVRSTCMSRAITETRMIVTIVQLM